MSEPNLNSRCSVNNPIALALPAILQHHLHLSPRGLSDSFAVPERRWLCVFSPEVAACLIQLLTFPDHPDRCLGRTTICPPPSQLHALRASHRFIHAYMLVSSRCTHAWGHLWHIPVLPSFQKATGPVPSGRPRKENRWIHTRWFPKTVKPQMRAVVASCRKGSQKLGACKKAGDAGDAGLCIPEIHRISSQTWLTVHTKGSQGKPLQSKRLSLGPLLSHPNLCLIEPS